ncbi:MAG: decaprenyl-phosphate phosphoribosyltransferase [Armatimonadetes bacterium]|nr:decaprenyl-phosphate phosphoribosyltransferase [Armatimonadota bacterium]
METLRQIVIAMRPRQWTKNLLVFAGLIFAQKAADWQAVAEAVEAFAIFCALAGAVYLVNDCLDVERDRLDPVKRNRPVAAGLISVQTALTAAVVLVAGGMVAAWLVTPGLLGICLAYVGISMAYSSYLKHIVIVDVFCVASGFVLRAVAGAIAVRAEVSPWLIICTLLLSLFLALCKRRSELVELGSEAANHRASLAEYSPHLLDQMIAVMTASTLMSYCLYTIADRTVAVVGSTRLLYTIPFVIYGIFRYLYLVHIKNSGGHPDRALLTDRPLQANLLLYLLTVAVVLYTGNGG